MRRLKPVINFVIKDVRMFILSMVNILHRTKGLDVLAGVALHVVQYPVPDGAHPGVHTRVAQLCTPRAPARERSQ